MEFVSSPWSSSEKMTHESWVAQDQAVHLTEEKEVISFSFSYDPKLVTIFECWACKSTGETRSFTPPVDEQHHDPSALMRTVGNIWYFPLTANSALLPSYMWWYLKSVPGAEKVAQSCKPQGLPEGIRSTAGRSLALWPHHLVQSDGTRQNDCVRSSSAHVCVSEASLLSVSFPSSRSVSAGVKTQTNTQRASTCFRGEIICVGKKFWNLEESALEIVRQSKTEIITSSLVQDGKEAMKTS